jgi:hypothetical protein
VVACPAGSFWIGDATYQGSPVPALIFLCDLLAFLQVVLGFFKLSNQCPIAKIVKANLAK